METIKYTILTDTNKLMNNKASVSLGRQMPSE